MPCDRLTPPTSAVTLPDGTPASSGVAVRVGGGGARPKFTHHMYLPMMDAGEDPPPAPDEPVTARSTINRKCLHVPDPAPRR